MKKAKDQIVVVGAGFAGTCASQALASLGFPVLLIDRRFRCPDLFRAEKIEGNQADLMRELGVLEHRAPRRSPIGLIRSFDARDGSEVEVDAGEQYGIDYGPTVNRLIETLPAEVDRLTGRVVGFDLDRDYPSVELEGGETVEGRVVVLATGGSKRLASAAGLTRRRKEDLRSMSFGFDVVRTDGGPFPFSGFNYTLGPNPALLDYITFFPIGDRMRVNLFSQLRAGDPLVSELRADMERTLARHFPELSSRVGAFRVAGNVKVAPTVFSRLHRPWVRRIVAIGDEHQTVSPTTGTGLSRALTDVAVLQRHARSWPPGVPVNQRSIRAFYGDRQKVCADRDALGSWMSYRNRQEGSPGVFDRLRRRVDLVAIR